MGNSRSILIVDDNPENLKLLSKILELENFRIRIAKNGIEAIKSVEAEIPSVILMDIQMPGIDGYETCRRIKRIDKFNSIPILFISALTETYDKIKAFEAGGQDYITKPFREEEVLARVRTHFKMFEYRLQLEDLNIDLYHQLQSSFEQAAIGIVHVDINTRHILKANKHYCEFIGYTQKELFSKTILDITDPDYIHSDKRDLQKIVSGEEKIITKKKQYICKNDIIKWGRVTFSLVKTLNENIPDYLIAFVEDISEQKATEEKLHTTQSHYYDFINSSSDAVTYWIMPKGLKINLPIKDQLEMIFDGVCEDVNKSARVNMGLRLKDQAVGKKIKDLFDLQRQDILDTFTKFISNKYSLENHLVHVITTKETEYYGLTNWYGKIRDGELESLWTVSKDISKLKAAEIEVKKSEGRLQEAQELAKLGNWEQNFETNKLFWSDELFNIYEIDKNRFEASYDAFIETIHSDDRHIVDNAYRKHLKDKSPYSIEYRLLMTDGRIKYILEQNSSIFNKKGEPEISVGTVQDITGKKKAENEILKLNRELEERVEQRTKELEQEKILTESILDAIPGVFYVLDEEGRYVRWNRNFPEILELTEKELKQLTTNDTIVKEDRGKVLDTIKEVYKKGSASVEMNLLTKNKKSLPYYVTGELFEKGGKKYILGVGIDISKRKEAEKEIKKLSVSVEQSPVSILITNIEGKIEYANSRFFELTGYTANEIIGANPSVLNSGYHEKEYFTEMWDTILAGEKWTGEICNKKKDGEIYWEMASISPIKDHKGKILHFVGVKEDITKRKENEAKLKYRSEIEKLLAEISTKMISLNIDDIDNEINNALFQICTFFKTETGYIFTFKDDYKLFSMTHLAVSSKIKTKIENKQNLGVESMSWWLNQLIDGKVVNVPSIKDLGENAKVSKELLLKQGIYSAIDIPMNYEGKIVGFIGFASEKSGRSWTKDELFLMHLAGQIFTNALQKKQTVKQLQIAQKEADDANNAKSIFLANMSHEIRTPMNAILGHAQLLQRDIKIRDEHKKSINTINKSGEHLLNIINDILDMSKIEAGKIKILPTSFRLHGLLHDLFDMLKYKYEQKNLYLKPEIDKNLPDVILGDEIRIRQVLINLLSNAIKFTSKGGIEIHAFKDKGHIGISVKDTGVGIASNKLESIFGAFEQTETGIKKAGGTGLGLAISRNIARLMGGDITVKSKPEIGSQFYFSFKYKKGRHEDLKEKVKQEYIITGLKESHKKIKILIVDDKKENRNIARMLLEEIGFVINEAENGKQAVELFSEWMPDLLIMDIIMPVMDGKQATKQIRNLKEGRKVGIIALSASAFDDDKDSIMKYGADVFLTKPYNEFVLLEEIRKLTGVEYTYEKDEYYSDHKAEYFEQKIEALPPNLKSKISKAVLDRDITKLSRLLEELRKVDEELAAYLINLTEEFELQKMKILFS